MTAHDPSIGRIAARLNEPARVTGHSLNGIDTQKLAKRLVVFTPGGREIDMLVARARVALPGIAQAAVVHRVVSHNPDVLWAIARQDRFNSATPKGEGFLAFLPLNHAGMQQLIAGQFDAANPDLTLVTRQHEKPAGVYVWAGVRAWRSGRWNSARARENLDPDLHRRRSLLARRHRTWIPLPRCARLRAWCEL